METFGYHWLTRETLKNDRLTVVSVVLLFDTTQTSNLGHTDSHKCDFKCGSKRGLSTTYTYIV